MAPIITINEKAIVTKTKTSEQNVRFLFPVPPSTFCRAGDNNPFHEEDSQDSDSDDHAEFNRRDHKIFIKDGDKLMCKLRASVTYQDDVWDDRDGEDKFGVLIAMTAKSALEMNMTVSAEILNFDGSHSGRKTDEKKYMAFQRTRSGDEIVLPVHKREFPFLAQQSRGFGGVERTDRDPEMDGHLIALFTMSITYVNPPQPNKAILLGDFSKKTEQEMKEAIGKLLACPGFQDIKLICSDGVEIPANKDLLAARCPFFEAMFYRSNMKEAETGVVHVDDVTGNVMKILVEYWYTGQLDESWAQRNVIEDLAVAADKYGVVPLVELLEGTMGDDSILAK